MHSYFGEELSRGEVIWGWIRYAAKLAGIFLICFVVALIQYFWAIAGRVNLSAVPAQIAADKRTADFPETSFTLDHGVRVLEFELAAKYQTKGKFDPYFYYEVWVHDADGREVGHWLGHAAPYKEPIAKHMGGIGIDRAGNYRARARLTGDQTALLVEASVKPMTNTRKSRFLVIMLLASIALFGAFVRHIYHHPLPRTATEPDDTMEPALPPFESPVQESWTHRVFIRLALEAVAIAVSFAWLPVLGLYFFIFGAASVMFPGAGEAAASTGIPDRLMALPFAQSVVDWLDWKNEYQGGFEVLIAIGVVMSKVIFLVWVVLMPIRLLVPRRHHPGFRGKAVLLLLLTLGLVGFFAFALRTAKLSPGTGYWDILATMTFFCGIGFVLSLGILGLSQLIEKAFTRWIDPAAAAEQKRTEMREATRT